MNNNDILIRAFSDWHDGGRVSNSLRDTSQNKIFDDADILIFAGDITMCDAQDFDTQIQQIEYFFNMLKKYHKLYKHIIVITGNHDVVLDKNKSPKYLYDKAMRIINRFKKDMKNLIFSNTLETITLNIKGKYIKFLLSPFSSFFNYNCEEVSTKWGFEVISNQDFFKSKKIQHLLNSHYDIVVSHSPKHYINDLLLDSSRNIEARHVGIKIFDKVTTDLFISGHIHEAFGQSYDAINKTLHINCSLLNENYQNEQRSPVVINFKK